MKGLKPALAAAMLAALIAVAFSAAAGAGTAPAQQVARQDAGLGTAHDLPGPLTKEFEARKQAGLEKKLKGEARGKVAKLGKNKYVELVREKTDPVFVIIAEFGNARHSSFCDAVDTDPAPPNPCAFPSDGSPQRYDGPGPQRDRSAEPGDRQLDVVAGRLQHRLTTRTCTSTAWRSTSSSSRRTATRSWAT